MNDSYSVPCLFPALSGQKACESFISPAFWSLSPLPLTVSVPGSKSITNRAMLLALLARGASTLKNCLFSDDSRHFLSCVRELGITATASEETHQVTISGCGGCIPAGEASLYVGSAGTAARFLTALAGVSESICHMDASAQMRRRPMAPLLQTLRELGAQISCHEKEGYFPFTITGHGFHRQELTVDITQSSQFLSALLIAAACSQEEIRIRTTGRHGMAYIAMTIRMMEQFGVHTIEETDSEAFRLFRIPGGQHYEAQHYQVEPDVSAACYFYALAPLLGIDVMVKDVHPSSMQGDIRFLQLLAGMGCTLIDTKEGILLKGPKDGCYSGITADMSACSDQAITLAALAPFASSPTTITSIGHIRCQESDRLTAMATELKRMGIRCIEKPDQITIWPGSVSPARIRTYDDHRMAMGFALTGLRAPGMVIEDPGCCRKTFEQYFDVLDNVIRRLTEATP
ncbi:MAG: 3-phosphoshikimate 1-carboxyvinyltransferase [Lachnospiraceae bacterium]|jgi:3-phosphoshikimate 1-carboxyvinyltransferase|nr:3-phosphoshikimate 1-carboxyvinyltransferase [Lachnospiraceae bacterium]